MSAQGIKGGVPSRVDEYVEDFHAIVCIALSLVRFF